MATPNYGYTYSVGGSLLPQAKSYVERPADQELYDDLKEGEFCYVLNSRQMGKSSLQARTKSRLQQEGYRCAAIDLTGIGSDSGITSEQWYRSFMSELNRSLDLLSAEEFDQWLAAREGYTSAYGLNRFIQDVVLTKTGEQSVVIFVDEIDSVLSLGFSTDDFFLLIRSFYNQRSNAPIYERLTFAFFGVASPAELVRDANRTPFNIGKAIQLTPLALENTQPLAEGLVGWVEHPQITLEEIFQWTGGQPFLTQKLCHIVQEKAESLEQMILKTGSEKDKVAEWVREHIIDDWEEQDELQHFTTIRDRFFKQERLLNRMLGLYQDILEKGEISVDNADEALQELRLTGAVLQTQKSIRTFNQMALRD